MPWPKSNKLLAIIFEIFWNLLESFGIFWSLLKLIGLFWNLFSSSGILLNSWEDFSLSIYIKWFSCHIPSTHSTLKSMDPFTFYDSIYYEGERIWKYDLLSSRLPFCTWKISLSKIILQFFHNENIVLWEWQELIKTGLKRLESQDAQKFYRHYVMPLNDITS